MTVFPTCGRAAVWPTLALAGATFLFAPVLAPAFAQAQSVASAAAENARVLDPVFVSAVRFASDPGSRPIGATVIDAQQIRQAGIGNVNEAIRKLGGIHGRQNASGTSDMVIDLRGFGETASQNMVVLVDGVRLSENELTVPLLSSIPIESVDRIEIVRGGSSVLYGEGATAGVIQVITKRGAQPGLHGTLVAELGTLGHKELRASLAQAWSGFSVDANLGVLNSDNYRDNNGVRQRNFGGGLQWAEGGTRVALRLDLARQDSRMAGALDLAQFRANPRQTLSPDDFGSYDSDRVTLSAEHRIGALELAAELSHRKKKAEAALISVFGDYVSRADSHVTQFSPRLRHNASFGAIDNELVLGLDLARWSRDTDATFGGFPSADARATQRSHAIYLRDEVRLDQWRIAAGARHERFDQDYSDPLSFSNTAYEKKRSLHAWELQAGYTPAAQLELFAKTGRSYRMANADENGLTPNLNQPLEPQISRDLEIGATLGNAQRKLTVRAFRHRLTDEIYYDPTAGVFGANANLDPTRRQGVELELRAQVSADFAVSANLRQVSARFVEGPNSGRQVPLVPRHTAALRLNWLPGNGHSADVGWQWTSKQRYGGDFSNGCDARIPAYGTFDARYAYRSGPWEVAVAGTNLTDKDYFSNAFGVCRNGIYPDSGRQLRLTLRRDF